MAKITVGNEWIGTTPRQMNVGDFVSDELARNQSQDTITRLDANLQRVADGVGRLVEVLHEKSFLNVEDIARIAETTQQIKEAPPSE